MDLPDFLKTNKDKEKQPEQTKTNPVGGDIYSTPKEQAQTPQNGEVQQTSTLNQKPKVQNPVAALNQETNLGLLDVIAPENIEIDFNYVKINDVYFRTLFVSGYPRFVSPGWLEPIINFDSSLDVSFYIYPVEGKSVLDDLRRKIAEMEAEISTDLERGKIVDPSTQAKLEDARSLQEQLVKGSERFFEFSFYITIPATNLEELDHLTRQIESTLGSLLMVGKQATLDMQNGFLSTAPLGVDKLSITRNMDTTSLATTFPLTSAELSSDKGILYGINSQNESFIIFDRFSLENSNMTIFATSGAGKSINYDEPVLYKNKRGSLKLEKIGKLIERTIKNGCLTKIDKEMEGVLKPNLQVLTFDRKLKTKWANVQVAARKVSPKTLHKVTTASGRQIKITGDHNLVILKKSQLKLARGKELEVGDNIPLPRKIDDYQKYHPLTINSYKILKDSRIKYLRIRNGRVGNRLFTPKTSIPDKIKIDAHFCEILGYFASEGMVKLRPSRSLITTTSPEVLISSKKYFEKIGLNHSFIKRGNKTAGIYVSAEVFSNLLHKLRASGKAGVKRVPPIVFATNKKNIACFLKAYFEGDGGVEKNVITATTKSKKLASDMAYILLRFGIIARIKRTFKVATNAKRKTKRKYFRIVISGQDNIQKFVNKIGFVSKEKQEKAKQLVREDNTNVDVVPELGAVFEEIRKELYASTEIPAPKKFSEIKLGIFKPSRQNLVKVVRQIEKDIERIENLELDGLSKLKKLPSIQEIVNAGSKKDINKKLWRSLGASWQTMREGVAPYTHNALVAAKITHGYEYSQEDIGLALYKTFKYTGESLRSFDISLWESVLYKNTNARYEKIIKARKLLLKVYKEKKKSLQKIKEKITWLKTLARSNLFWDPIVKIEKIKAKHKYVYDLQVENGVFLAGHAGMFVHNSYFVKLEALRSLMLGSEIIVIDPESEYKALAEAVGGEHISFSFNSPSKINPFDLSNVYEEGENSLGLKILTLHSLFKVIMGELSATQEALLDRALVATYRAKGITQDPETQKKEPPLMEDLYKQLAGMETDEGKDLAARIEKFVRGSFVGIFDKQTNVDIRNPFTVFSVRDLQDALRPIAMFIILDFIWTRIRRDLKRRILIVDEAWHMMQYKDSAQFLWSIVKRARKYFLGLTTITQDVEDFLSQDIGKAIVTNSALRLLLKQSPAAIDKIGEIFYLSQGEKQLLLAANIGEGIFFAGPHHAPIRIVSSNEEHELITTRPQEKIGEKEQVLETPSPTIYPLLKQQSTDKP